MSGAGHTNDDTDIALRLINPRLGDRWYSLAQPAPTITAGGIGHVFHQDHALERTARPSRRSVDPAVPPYRPLTMAEVRAAPSAGLSHVSTFSGAGGSCLGFALAGFSTLWANDIDAYARACYRLNLPSPMDGRDLRSLTGAKILEAAGLQVGDLDVFEGSPPCTAFSVAGPRAKGWNQTKTHAGHTQTNIEDLFFTWLRLVAEIRPRAFVAENVPGMVIGVAKGYFKMVLRHMRALGYQVAAQVLDAQWLGVPQKRRRVFFIGIREDLGIAPRFPAPASYRYVLADALPWLAVAHYDSEGHYPRQVIPTEAGVMPTIIGGTATGHYKVESVDAPGRPRKLTIEELKRICSFPDDYQLVGSYSRQWMRLGNSVPPRMAAAVAGAVRDVLLEVRGRA